VLVTGGSGFIGARALEPLAARGFEVHAVSRTPAGDAPASVTWHTADLLDGAERGVLLEQVRPSHLLHLAWYAEPGAFWSARENADWVVATIALLQAFAAAGGRRAVVAGTCAEYDWSSGGVLAEGAALAPHTYYGVAKDATRRVAEGLAALDGVELAWGRIFLLYGPGEDERRLVASVARALVRGERVPTTSGEQVRDFLHVDDVAAAFAALVAGDVQGAVNIGSGEGVTVRRVVELIAAAAGRPELLDVGVLPSRAGEPAVLVADTTRLRDEAGFAPAIGLQEGIAQTVEWWGSR
jgi:nucleoside-diphosphate-sugar epimerase